MGHCGMTAVQQRNNTAPNSSWRLGAVGRAPARESPSWLPYLHFNGIFEPLNQEVTADYIIASHFQEPHTAFAAGGCISGPGSLGTAAFKELDQFLLPACDSKNGRVLTYL